MARHNEILDKFKVILADGFSFENEAHKSMVRVYVSLKKATVLLWEYTNLILHCIHYVLAQNLCLKSRKLFFDRKVYMLFLFVSQLMQIMIKVSDVSNEARPMEVAEPWLDCLLQEFFIQVSVNDCSIGAKREKTRNRCQARENMQPVLRAEKRVTGAKRGKTCSQC